MSPLHAPRVDARCTRAVAVVLAGRGGAGLCSAARGSSMGHGRPRLAADARVWRGQAKTTKKITLKLTCSAQGRRLKPIKRAKHFEICDKKPKTKADAKQYSCSHSFSKN